ncbi:hypothetical protein VspSTUT16_30780 [Vibrio sp. STUT-A16]|nr:hypothetical protein VspSTUT16_30780 [Vibrio sp. STUT-A16]
MSIIVVQGFDVITAWVVATAKKGTVFAMFEDQFTATFRTRLVFQSVFMGREKGVVDFTTHTYRFVKNTQKDKFAFLLAKLELA